MNNTLLKTRQNRCFHEGETQYLVSTEEHPTLNGQTADGYEWPPWAMSRHAANKTV